MKWLELHLDTQPAGIEPATELLSEYGIDSLMIDEEGDFKDFLENNHQYWDYVDDELMEQMHGKSRITFYLEDSAGGYNTEMYNLVQHNSKLIIIISVRGCVPELHWWRRQV